MRRRRLRVIDGGIRSAVDSQALWYGVARALSPDDDPALVLVTPAEPYVCIGYHQNAAVELDQAACRAAGIGVLRRRLGGGAVLLDGRQLIFHYVWPRDAAPRQAAALYGRFLEPLIRCYRHLGIAAVYRPVNDLQVDGRKIAGAAAAEIGDAVVVGSMVLFDFDGALMARLLRLPAEKMRDKLAGALDRYVVSLGQLLTDVPSRAAMIDLMLRQSANALAVAPEACELTADEQRAMADEVGMLATVDWTLRSGRKFVADGVKLADGVHLAEGRHKAPGGLIRVTLLERRGQIAELAVEGDFTCLRPAALGELCRRLAGATLDPAGLELAVADAVAALALDLPGVAPTDLARAILAARRDGC